MPEVGAVLGTKDKNYKDIFQNLQEYALQCLVVKYKKELDIYTLIKKLEDADLSIKEPTAPTGTRNRDPIETAKKLYELEL